MGRYVIRRLLQVIPVFFGTTFIIFAGVFMIPGDPIRALFGEKNPGAQVINNIREKYHLNDPLLIQYYEYMKGVLVGDLGVNFRDRPVTEIIAQAAPVSIKLGLTAFGFEIVVGLLAGILAGLRRGGFFDNLTLIVTTLIISIPSSLVPTRAWSARRRRTSRLRRPRQVRSACRRLDEHAYDR